MPYKKHLLHVFSTFNTGGPQVRSCDLIQYMGEDYRHSIIAMDHQYGAKDKIPTHANVDYIDLSFKKSNKNTLNIAFYIRSFLKKLKPDLLLTSNWGTIEWAMANAFFPICPHIHAEDGFGTEEILKQKKRRIWTRRIFLQRPSCIVVPSLVLKNIALNMWKIPPEKVLYIPNGIEEERFFTSDFSSKQEQTIGIVTGLRKIKNIPRLIEAFSSLSSASAKLWIIGDGEESEYLQKFVSDKGLEKRIHFWGHQKDPSSLLKQMTIFALSSDSEQMPVSVLEAMAAGCAIISTDVGDIKNMVSEANQAFIVPLSSPELYSNKLQELIADKNLCFELGRKNQEKCHKEYTIQRMLETYRELYRKAIK